MKQKAIIIIFLFSLAFFLSCKNYYMVRSGNTGSIDSLSKTNRVFILRSGSESYIINSLYMSEDKKSISCKLDLLPGNHMLHVSNLNSHKLDYSQKDLNERPVVNEVHFFTRADSLARPGNYTLQLSDITRIEILEHDRKKSTNSHVLGAIGITVSVIAIVAVIAVALKSSCPFISAWDGTGYSLQGEVYGGSIYPQLERSDFLPLKMATDADNMLRIKITNELKERQYTDHVRLWEITHPAETRLMVDETGNLLSISQPRSPIKAMMNHTKDVLPSLEKRNDYNQTYMDDTSVLTGVNEITMTFARPAGVTKGKLVLSLKNSYFLDLLYGELAKGFGTYYAAYMKQQKKKSREELLRWVQEQKIPLEIAVNNGNGWQTVKQLTTIGPVAFRETAIEIPVPESGNGELQVRLQSGFLFWEIDYAAIDFSPTVSYTVNKLDPLSAFDEKGHNVLSLLSREDGKYLDQPEIGNAATVSFGSGNKTAAGMTKTYILECRGYYEHLRDFTNPPNREFLEQFRKPGAFPLFGLQLFRQLQPEKQLLAQSK